MSKNVRTSSEVIAAKEVVVGEAEMGQIVYIKVSGVDDREVDAVQLKVFMLWCFACMVSRYMQWFYDFFSGLHVRLNEPVSRAGIFL